jgi:hypothetical protein
MLQSFVQALLTLAAAIRHIQSEPAIPGIEALLIERGDEPLQARVMARVIHICGERWARERTEIEKPLAGVLRRLADEAKATPPVVSRRAKALQQWLDRGDDVDVFFRDWLEEAGSRLSTQDLREITMLAANRDESACQRLVEIAEALAPYLPDPPREARVHRDGGLSWTPKTRQLQQLAVRNGGVRLRLAEAEQLLLCRPRDRKVQGHVELAGDKRQHRGRRVADDCIFDAIQVRPILLPVIRVARHRFLIEHLDQQKSS